MTPEQVGGRLAELLAGSGPVQPGPTSGEHGPGEHGSVEPGPGEHGSVEHGPGEHGSVEPGPGEHGSVERGPFEHGPVEPGLSVRTGVCGGQAYARATVDVPPSGWRRALLAARDDAELRCDFFDWLSAVDELAGGFDIVAHLWSTTQRHGVLVRSRIPREAAVIDSVVDIYPGAAWHERETHEMFGVDFAGHQDLRPLLLPPEFEGHPLRKEFVLASRVAKPWPGAKEPGEPAAGAGRRQPMRPPGVPAPGEWGPAAGDGA